MDARRSDPLTVILPVAHYHPDFLGRALDSLARQTSPHWRLLVVGEADNHDRLAAFLEDRAGDARIRLSINEGKRLAGAVNTGMRQADTPFSAILLGDDMWTEQSVEVLERAIGAHPHADFFHSARRFVDENDRPISGVYAAIESFTLDDFKRRSPVKHLLCWRNSKALEIGGLDEDLPSVGADDYDFPWSMAEAGARFFAIQECLYLYRDHRESYRLTTHQPLSEWRAGLRRLLEKHGASQADVQARLRRAEAGFLRQCLYRSRLDRGLKRLLGHDPRHGWREVYE